MKYIGYYDTKQNQRSMNLAAVNKMNYVIRALNAAGYHVEVIACGMVADIPEKKCTEVFNKQTEIHYFKANRRRKGIVFSAYELIRRNMKLFMYLMCNVKRGETIIVYHSLALMRCVNIAKWFKRFKLLLEIEEIYNDVYLHSRSSKNAEIKFLKSADKYLFSSELICEKLQLEQKPHIVVYGPYDYCKGRTKRMDDGRIHVVYAGSFNPIKGGAAAAIQSAAWLPENYHIHILGRGTDYEREIVLEEIKEINKESKCLLTYDGVKFGDEYSRFLQACDIGLSTQDPSKEYNASSFPSKILTYMGNGLRVVSSVAPAVKRATISRHMYYYSEQKPEKIAEAILNVDLQDGYNGSEVIKMLDEECIDSIKKLLSADED